MRRLTKAEKERARRVATQAGIWALPATVAGAAAGKKYAVLTGAAAGTSGALAELNKAHPAQVVYTVDRNKEPIPASKRRAKRLRNMAGGAVEGAVVGGSGAMLLGRHSTWKTLATGIGGGATTGITLGALKPVPMTQTRYSFEPVKAPETVKKGYQGYLGDDGVPEHPAGAVRRAKRAAAAPARQVRRVRAVAQDKAARVMATGQGARVHGLNQSDVDLRYRKAFL